MLPKHNRFIQILYYLLLILMFALAVWDVVYFYYVYVG